MPSKKIIVYTATAAQIEMNNGHNIALEAAAGRERVVKEVEASRTTSNKSIACAATAAQSQTNNGNNIIHSGRVDDMWHVLWKHLDKQHLTWTNGTWTGLVAS